MTKKLRTCRECGTKFELAETRHGGAQTAQRFCSTLCRKTWNNRRMTRGAEAYDVICGIRRERATAKAEDLWTVLCRLEATWREEDERDGRPQSYYPPREAKMRLLDAGRVSRHMTHKEIKEDGERRNARYAAEAAL